MINLNDPETFYGLLWGLFISALLLIIEPLGIIFVWFIWFVAIAYPNRDTRKKVSPEEYHMIVYKKEWHSDFYDYSCYEATYQHEDLASEAKKARENGDMEKYLKTLDLDEHWRKKFNEEKEKREAAKKKKKR